MNLLFRQDMEPSCSYCQYGVSLGLGEVVCRKCGIMSSHGKCNSFRYDPTKREPDFAVRLNTSDLDEGDFALT
ncbi:MAG: hypothetical protein FWC13_02955 [Oscillospiraceae bacterium]|nr:hypothetical protein [Oscillospiraceae bacterium]